MTPQGSILKRFAERLEANGVEADARQLAAVVLDLARELDWLKSPEAAAVWLSQLAVEVAQSSPVRRASLHVAV